MLTTNAFPLPPRLNRRLPDAKLSYAFHDRVSFNSCSTTLLPPLTPPIFYRLARRSRPARPESYAHKLLLRPAAPGSHPDGATTHYYIIASHFGGKNINIRRRHINRKQILTPQKQLSKRFSMPNFSLATPHIEEKSLLSQKKESKDLANKNFALSLHPQLSPNEAKVARLAYSSIG